MWVCLRIVAFGSGEVLSCACDGLSMLVWMTAREDEVGVLSVTVLPVRSTTLPVIVCAAAGR